MKRTIITLIFILMQTLVFGFIITVDNKSPSAGNYTTLQDAHDVATAGDTIFVYPSGVSYAGINVTKKLILYGTGFENDFVETGIMNITSISGTMTFSEGADSSILSGFGTDFHVIIDADNIQIKRNKFNNIKVYENHSGTVIMQNYIFTTNNISYALTVDQSNEVIVNNNIIFDNDVSHSQNGISADGATITITILNNVIKADHYTLFIRDANEYVVNNIFFGDGECWNCSNENIAYIFNISSNNNNWPAGNGNLNGIDMDDVFIPGWESGNYHLLDSLAIGSGLDGIDRGIYGGDAPYIDGGIPSLPSIYQLQTPFIGSKQSGLDVIIKAKTNE